MVIESLMVAIFLGITLDIDYSLIFPFFLIVAAYLLGD